MTIHDDGTTSNEDRLGAIGDMLFVVDRIGADDDLLVIAGDNLFDFRVSDLVAFWQSKAVASAVAVRDVGSLELARQYGIVDLDADGRIQSFVEKPAEPASTLAATATYLYHREHVGLIRAYVETGNADQPGRFVAWLHEREPVYGWVFAEPWYDIGDHEQLLEADNRLRAAAGLAARARTNLPDEKSHNRHEAVTDTRQARTYRRGAWLIDVVFPPRCVSCAASASVLCAPCRQSLRRPGPVICGRCGAPTLWPVERCRECAGRRLALRARVRRSPTPARRGSSSRPGRSTASAEPRSLPPSS